MKIIERVDIPVTKTDECGLSIFFDSVVTELINPQLAITTIKWSKRTNMLNVVNEKVLNARKSGDKFTANTFQLVKAELLNNQKTEKPRDETEVVRSYVKKLGKSLDSFKGTAQYDDLVKEFLLVETILPQQLSEDAVRFEVNKYILANPDEKNMGKVMGALKILFKDAPVDSAVIAKVAKEVIK